MNLTFPIGCFLGAVIGTSITIWIKNQEIKIIRENFDDRFNSLKEFMSINVKRFFTGEDINAKTKYLSKCIMLYRKDALDATSESEGGK